MSAALKAAPWNSTRSSTQQLLAHPGTARRRQGAERPIRGQRICRRARHRSAARRAFTVVAGEGPHVADHRGLGNAAYHRQCPLLKCRWPPRAHRRPAVQAGKIWLMYSRCNTGPNYRMNLAYCDVRARARRGAAGRHFSGGRPVIVGNGGDDAAPATTAGSARRAAGRRGSSATALPPTSRRARAARCCIPFNDSGGR